MKLSEGLDMKGRLTLQTYDRQGNLVQKLIANNAIVRSGREMVAKLFISQPSASISHLGLGSGKRPVDAVKDTHLDQEFFRKAIGSAAWGVTDDQTKIKVTLTTDLDFHEANGELREAGLFNSAEIDSPTMYNRVVFPVINKTEDFQLTLKWEITF